MKSIAFVIESLHCGGAEKSLVTLLQNINFDKYEVDLIMEENNGEFQKFVPEQVKIKIIDYYSKANKIKKNYLRLLFFEKKLINFNKNFHLAQLHWKAFKYLIKPENKKYDIAIAYNQGFATYYVATKIQSDKKYSWLNTDYQKAGYNINFDYAFYNKFDKVICVSKENEISFLNEVIKINKNINTSIIKDITDFKSIKELSLEKVGLEKNTDNKISILTVGRLAKAKGYHLAIESCEILISKGLNIKWFVIGEGPERDKLETLIKEKKIENNFILLGYKENPYPFIKSCDIYVQTSLFEGLGLTVIEAGILEKPIVTTNFPTAYSIIEHEKTGLIAEMNSISISNAIELYLENPELKERVINNLTVCTNSDKELSIKKINELFTA